MTIEEYFKEMDKYIEKLKNKEVTMDDVAAFQYEYMIKLIADYDASTPEKAECKAILEEAVFQSFTGEVCHYIEDKELADKVIAIIEDELGQYLLGSPECHSYADGGINIDCMFGGYFVPDWDGFAEYYEDVEDDSK